mgnify:CR=1 FL=1
MEGLFIFDQQRTFTANKGNPMANKKEEWVNPRIIEFNLSKWDHEKHIHYISYYNGLYIGCSIKPGTDVTYMEIANVILSMELTPRMYSSNLSRMTVTVKDKPVRFIISPRRVEVSYGLAR